MQSELQRCTQGARFRVLRDPRPNREVIKFLERLPNDGKRAKPSPNGPSGSLSGIREMRPDDSERNMSANDSKALC